MAKRGQGEGSISKRPDGTYWARITLGKDENGKQKRKAFYGKTRKEVQEKLTAALNDINNDTYIEPSKMTVAQWMDIWLYEYKKRSLKHQSYVSLKIAITNCVIPELGQCKLKELRTDTVQRFINKLSDRGLSLSYIKKSHNSLNMAFKKAVQNGMVSRNIITDVQLPKEVKKPVRVFTPDEQRKFIEVASNAFAGDLFIVMLATGLRIGEALALTWDDIDFVNKTLTVNKGLIYCYNPDGDKKHIKTIGEPKTESSNRNIPLLPSISEMLEKKKDYPKNKKNIVFPGLSGDILTPPAARRRFKSILQKAGIADAHIHTLRHTFATRGLENGIELKVMQEFLGHSSIEMTADIYTHVLPDKKADSIMKLADSINI